MENVYLIDVLFLVDEIKRRRLTQYIVQTRITSFPHMKEEDQREFVNLLMSDTDIDIPAEEIDSHAAVETLRQLMSKSKGFKVQ